MRRKIFSAIYGRGTRPRSKKQIMEAAGIKSTGTNAQQVQNELDHLTQHHLIVRVENGGTVKDGSRYLYLRDAAVRANREKIVRLADNRRAAARVPTKRRLVIHSNVVSRGVTKQTLKRKRILSVLYLLANPDADNSLRVDAEVRRVQEAIRGSKFRQNVSVLYRPAADVQSLLDGLNDHRPQVVHFSGHGDEAGIATDTGSVKRPEVRMLSY